MLGQGPAGHALVETQLDPLFGVLGLVVQEHLRHVDLAAEELLGEVRSVVRPVLVRAENDDLAVEAMFAEPERRGVARASAPDDDDARHQPSDNTRAWWSQPSRSGAARLPAPRAGPWRAGHPRSCRPSWRLRSRRARRG